MNELEKQRKVVLALSNAIIQVEFAAAVEQNITHEKHICEHYQKVLDELDLKLTGERARLSRLEIIGR